jgi:hypothetical protein
MASRYSLSRFNQGADTHPPVWAAWLFINDQDDCAAGWGDLGVIIRNLMGGHTFSVLVPFLPKNLDEVAWSPLAAGSPAGIASKQLKELHGFNHGIARTIPDQDPVRINVVVIP